MDTARERPIAGISQRILIQIPSPQSNRFSPQLPVGHNRILLVNQNPAVRNALFQLPSHDEARRKAHEDERVRAMKNEQRRVQEERLQDEDVAAAYSESLSPEEGTFAEYSPTWVRNPAFHRHTDPVVESSSLASVIPPKPTFRLRLPLRTIVKGRLSDLQLEAVLHACSQARGIRFRRPFIVDKGPKCGMWL